jgi:hypothetical protein
VTATLWDAPDDVEVLVSVASAWQRFHGCTPDYIANVCHGRCCDAPGRPGGTMITIHRSEQAAIEARGGAVSNGLLVTTGKGKCTFKDAAGLCGLHFTDDKPFGCIASPFTVAPGGRTLVVRNRYRSLICYSATTARRGEDTSDWPPAYVAFRASLDLILGPDLAAWLSDTLDAHGDPKADGYTGPTSIPVPVSRRAWEMLTENDDTKRAAKVSGR